MNAKPEHAARGLKRAPSAVFALLLAAAHVQAQPPPPGGHAYPVKPVTVIVGAARGGDTDLVTRTVMRQLGRQWDKTFLVENRVAVMGSVMALHYVSKRPADGYTLSVASGSTYLNAALVSKMPLNVLSALNTVAQLTASPLLLVASPSLPVENLREFVKHVRSNPGKLNYASTGIGGSAHLATEYLKHELKLSVGHIPYEAVSHVYQNIAAGRASMGFVTALSALSSAQRGKLRLLGVTSPRRLPGLPDVPALAELIPGFQYTSFIGVVAPHGTPRSVVGALNKGLNEALLTPQVSGPLSSGGMSVAPATPEAFGKEIRRFISHAESLVKDAGLDLRQNQ